jgi:carboxylate-amine ligase
VTDDLAARVVADTGRVRVPAFRNGGDFTVGVEEELMLVDADGELLGADAGPLVERLCRLGAPDGVVSGEIYVDEVELNSPVCRDAGEVVASLRGLRRAALDAGARVMATGVHPTAPLAGAVLARSPRYDWIVEEYAGLLRTPTAATQVHVGLPDETTAMLAYRGLRHQVPLLRALAAGSPYWHGVDSGLASSRAGILRSYPRTTVPPLLRSWDEFVVRTEAMLDAAEATDHTYVWWEMRPRPLLGTLELRMMDAVPSLSAVAGLTALVQGIAMRAVESPDPDDLSDDVLAINDHRAARHGLETRVVDVDRTLRPLREVGVGVLAEVRGILARDGLDGPLDAVEAMLAGTGEPERQRRLVATTGMPALLADLAARTADLDG